MINEGLIRNRPTLNMMFQSTTFNKGAFVSKIAYKRPSASQPAACQPGLLVCLHKSSSSALVRLSRYPECTSSLSNPLYFYLYLYLSFTSPRTGCTSSLSNPSANWRPPLLRTAGVAGLMQQCTHRIAPSQAQMNSALFQK